MPLTAGSKLGPYEIQSSLGAGGMGEVYAARDTRLDRTVAIKILPEHLSEKPEAHARFEREARAVSSLNHPNICQLYDVGEQGGVRYIVMEHLQGETLADRLKKGPLPLEQLTRIGAAIGDGLQCAHRSGIVHRDLKPGNIMLTKAGAKILDFGLAKGGSITGSAHDLMVTLSSPALSDPLTAEGSLVGTFQYMAPEQVEGKEATASSDIFSFGSVLYEMATGNRAFEGKSQISVASSILEKDPPPVATVIPTAPPSLDHVIRGCLAKDPDSRWHSAGDIARELRWIGSNSGSSSQISAPAAALPIGRRTRERIAWAALAVALLGIVLWLALRPVSSNPVVRSSLLPPPDTVFDFDGDFSGPPVLSADATQVAFCANGPKERNSIWVQPLNSNLPKKIPGTEGALFPFWSPDGSSIGFFADGKLKTVPVAGGSVSLIADAPNPRGGAWGADNAIIYTPDYRNAIWIVHPNQLDAKRLTAVDQNLHSTHRWPNFLPDGKHFLFLATNHGGGNFPKYGIYMGSVDEQQSKFVLESDSTAQYADGYLLFHRGSQLMAQKFDWKKGTLSGAPMTLIDKVDYDIGTWRTTFSASANGVLIYQGATLKSGYNLTWLDRKGNVLGKAAEGIPYNGEKISPDGKRVALALGDPKPDIWILDFARNTRTRITFDPAIHSMPSWSADGQHIMYNTQVGVNITMGSTVRTKQSSGTGQESIVLDGSTSDPPTNFNWPQWSADGKYLAYQKQSGPINATFWAQSKTGDPKPFLVLQPQSAQSAILQTRLSPDGHWLAYTSTDSGREEVYITTFPSASGRWQISQNGGGYPAWRGDGKELFFFGPGDSTAYAADLKTNGAEMEAGVPHPLFVVRNTSSVGYVFDVSPDGQRFLVPTSPNENTALPMSLVTNWPTLLNK